MHFYEWEGEIYRQISGGPIGLRASGVVGCILMDFWVKLIKKKSAESQIQHSKNPEIYESLKIHTLWKYVDDCVCILGKLRLGTRYVNGRLEWAKEWQDEDMKTDLKTDKNTKLIPSPPNQTVENAGESMEN